MEYNEYFQITLITFSPTNFELNRKCICPSFIRDDCFKVLMVHDESFSSQFIVDSKIGINWKSVTSVLNRKIKLLAFPLLHYLQVYAGESKFCKLWNLFMNYGNHKSWRSPLHELVICFSGNGVIDFIEFLQMMAKMASDIDETIKEAFYIFDSDGSGAISSEEFREVMVTQGKIFLCFSKFLKV